MQATEILHFYQSPMPNHLIHVCDALISAPSPTSALFSPAASQQLGFWWIASFFSNYKGLRIEGAQGEAGWPGSGTAKGNIRALATVERLSEVRAGASR